ncbi:CDP-glycerol glycerophosphotransferase family protein [Actinomycetaceae bacterium MB13-C1-2]|nr:CDP-glycerol glycerophosphotransferase family protein [Actinomycetaceae bacterium MB13-C1-2]
MSETQSSARATPSLTVVMPTFDVREYIDEAVDSVLSQEGVELELIIIDDGSRDGTRERVIDLQTRDARIKVICSDHFGNGVARNLGIAVAKGKYLGFCDADDIVPQGAYASMIERLEETGSDFVSGAYRRLDGDKYFQPRSVSESNPERRDSVSLVDVPGAMKNPFLWSKVFKRDFWNEKVGPIPEGRNYEDQLPTALAFAEASAFDLMDEIVYTWRIRPASSLTQRKHVVEDLFDRTFFIDQIASVYMQAGPDVFQYWLSKLVQDDLYYFLIALPKANEDFLQELTRVYAMVADDMSTQTIAELPFFFRLVLEVSRVSDSPREDLESILLHRDRYGDYGYEILSTDHGHFIDSPVLELLSFIPEEETVTFREQDFKYEPVVVESEYCVDGSVRLSIDIGLHGVHDLSGLDVSVSLTSTDDRVTVPEWTVQRNSWSSVLSSDALVDHGEQTITLNLDARLLEALDPVEFVLEVECAAFGSRLRQSVRYTARSGVPGFGELTDSGRRWLVLFRNGKLMLHPEQTYASVRVLKAANDVLTVKASSYRDPIVNLALVPENAPAAALLPEGPLVRREGDTDTFHVIGVELPSSLALRQEVIWGIFSEDTTGRVTRLALSGNDLHHSGYSTGNGLMGLKASGFGYASFGQTRWRCVVTSAALVDDGDMLKFSGFAPRIEGLTPKILLVSGNGDVIQPVMVRRSGPNAEFWEASFPLVSSGTVPAGRYTLRWMASWQRYMKDAYYIEFGLDVSERPEIEVFAPCSRISIMKTDTGMTSVTFSSRLVLDERGRYNQHQLQQLFTQPLPIAENQVFFECFNGKSFGDNVAPVAEQIHFLRPDLRLLVSASSSVPALPNYVERLVPYSEEWYRALTTSKYIVTNNNLPWFFSKRPGQRYVQLWHGTPLKRLLRDMRPESRMLDYWDLMQREIPQWDGLLAQNPYSANRFQQAFGYEGDVRVLGYPRNDLLVDQRQGAKRDETRSALGLSSDDFVILYMPTWRDNLRDKDGQVKNADFFDFELVLSNLPENGRILFRSHHVASSGRPELPSGVIDVTSYPEVSELYLAADALVTDYSSTMFDFAILRKPMIFFSPDIDEYSGTNRGMYLEYEDWVPGPVVRSNEELIDVLQYWDVIGAPIQSSRIDNWIERFSPADDGRASERVAHWILESSNTT